MSKKRTSESDKEEQKTAVVRTKILRRLPAARFQPTKCCLCGAIRLQVELFNVRIWSEKLLIVLAALSRNEITVSTARELSAALCVFFVCPQHLKDAHDEMFEMLHVKVPAEIQHAEPGRVIEAMDKVHSFRTGYECIPLVNEQQFLKICHSFAVKYPKEKTDAFIAARSADSLRPAPDIRSLKYQCRICDNVCDFYTVRHIVIRSEKLLVLIAATGKSEMTFDIAGQLYSNSSLIACAHHLPEACVEIMRMLKVTHPRDIRTIGKTTREAGTVRSLASRILERTVQKRLSSELVFCQLAEVCSHFFFSNGTIPVQLPEAPPIVDVGELQVVRKEFVEAGTEIKDEEEKEEEEKWEWETEDEEEEEMKPEATDKEPRTECQICKQPSDDVHFITVRAEKLLLLLVSIHRKQITKQTAQTYYSRPTLYICHEHFADSCRDLSAMLKLVYPMDPTDHHTLAKVLVLANFVRNSSTLIREPILLQYCRDFWRKHGGEVKEIEKTGAEEEPVATCKLCGTIRRKSDVRSVGVLSERMILLVTEVARGVMTRGLARQYFRSEKELSVCRWHLVETCKTLCTMFAVARPEAFLHPKKTLVDSTMRIVDYIQKGRFPYATGDGKHFVQQCQRFTNRRYRQEFALKRQLEKELEIERKISEKLKEMLRIREARFATLISKFPTTSDAAAAASPSALCCICASDVPTETISVIWYKIFALMYAINDETMSPDEARDLFRVETLYLCSKCRAQACKWLMKAFKVTEIEEIPNCAQAITHPLLADIDEKIGTSLVGFDVTLTKSAVLFITSSPARMSDYEKCFNKYKRQKAGLIDYEEELEKLIASPPPTPEKEPHYKQPVLSKEEKVRQEALLKFCRKVNEKYDREQNKSDPDVPPIYLNRMISTVQLIYEETEKYVDDESEEEEEELVETDSDDYC
ncbi:unnamed protein product [Caenorhabditis sp. 36 PRJEB53466]|nr:unnamed protein product [Caenorhabditis sp. 36 PRJEB53466]